MKIYYNPKYNQLMTYENKFSGVSISHAIADRKISIRKMMKHGPKKLGWVLIGEL